MVAKAKKKTVVKKVKKDVTETKETESKDLQEAKVESEGKAAPVAQKKGKGELEQAAIAEVEKAIDASLQGKSRKNICKVPDDWHTKYKPTLGTWKKFVVAQTDKFRVIDLANG